MISPESRGGTRWLIRWILVPFALLAAANIAVFPPWELPDERDHFLYAQWIAEHHELPPLYPDENVIGRTDRCRISYNPPLYYLLIAPLTGGLPPATAHVMPRRNRPGVEFQGSPELRASFSERLYLIRALGVLLILAAVAALYASARTLSDDSKPFALLVCALFALNPKIVQFSGAVNNEVLSCAMGAFLTALLLRRVSQKEPSRSLPWLTGLCCGLALLTRVTLLPLALLPFVPILRDMLRTGITRRHVREVAIAGGLTLLIAGGWYLRNALNYGDVLGFRTIQANWYPPEPPAKPTELSLIGAALEVAQVSLSTHWAILYLLVIPGLVGWVRSYRSAPTNPMEIEIRRRHLTLYLTTFGALTVLTLLLFSYFLRTSHTQGRYLIPALSSAALLAALALWTGWPALVRRILPWLVLLLMAANTFALWTHAQFHRP